MPADLSAIWSFSRAPLAWAAALLALNVGIAFLEPVTVNPEPWCDDWLWCPEDRAVGVTLSATPALHIYMLAALPTPFLGFGAAWIAGVRSNARATNFMIPALAAFLGTISLCFMWANWLLLFYDIADSYPPAITLILLQAGIVLGTLAALAVSVVVLLCATGWRIARSGL